MDGGWFSHGGGGCGMHHQVPRPHPLSSLVTPHHVWLLCCAQIQVQPFGWGQLCPAAGSSVRHFIAAPAEHDRLQLKLSVGNLQHVGQHQPCGGGADTGLKAQGCYCCCSCRSKSINKLTAMPCVIASPSASREQGSAARFVCWWLGCNNGAPVL